MMTRRVSVPPAARQFAMVCLVSVAWSGLPAMAAPAGPAVQETLRNAPLTQLRYQSTGAHLTHTVGDVKVNGQSVHAGVRLQENAQVTTGEDSSAVLVLADGSQVKLMPNTVAEVVLSRFYLKPERETGGRVMNWFAAKMRLAQGALEAAVKKVAPRAKPLEVETANSLIGVRGTRFRVAAADPTAPLDRAEVLHGKVKNENTSRRSAILLAEGQGAVVDPNHARLDAVPLLPAVQFGSDPAILKYPDVTWHFPAVPGAKAYRVIVASDASYETVYRSEKVAGTQVSLDGLSTGTWHLRVRGVDALGLEGKDGDTRVELCAPDSLLLHPSLFMINGRLTLRWSDIRFCQAKKPLQAPSTLVASIYQDPAHTRLVDRVSSGADKEITLPRLGFGTYYLHISASNPELPKAEEQSSRFIVPANAGILPYHLLLDLGQGS